VSAGFISSTSSLMHLHVLYSGGQIEASGNSIFFKVACSFVFIFMHLVNRVRLCGSDSCSILVHGGSYISMCISVRIVSMMVWWNASYWLILTFFFFKRVLYKLRLFSCFTENLLTHLISSALDI